jgi:CubicO group peptidase (beta-lactamase class C family)
MSHAKRAVAFDERKVDGILAAVDCTDLPGAAVGIAINGRPVYRKGFGLASMELPVVLSPSIRMRIASMTKHFTCLAYLLLCEEGRAQLDDAVGKHLPDLHPVTHAVTVRQLMGHLSGLRDVHDVSWMFSGTGRPVSSADLLAFYRDIDDVAASPGAVWNYSNGGYLLLTAIIERITGESLEEVFRKRIFEPVGMYDTLLRRSDTDFVANSATLHMTSRSGRFEKSYIGTDSVGDGGVVSTVDDMLRWLAHMDAPVVGTAATWELMKTPLRLANGTSSGYGLGLVTDFYRGVETLFHSGGLMGCNSHMLKVPAAGLDVVIMVNRHDVFAFGLVNQILDAVLPGLEPIVEESQGALANGVFRSPKSQRVLQLYARDGKQVGLIDGMEMPFAPDARGALRPTGWASFFKLAIERTGDLVRPAAIRFTDFGNVDELIALGAPATTNVTTIAGEYISPTTGTQISISATSDGPRLVSAGRFGSAEYRLECIAEGIWRAQSMSLMPWGAILSFDRDSGACRFTTARNWALKFQRVS